MPGSFIDSNVLLYLISDDEAKATRAEDFLRLGGTISVQVLNECASVARRKTGLTWSALHTFLGGLRKVFAVVPVTIETHELGINIAQRYGLATYDAMIAAAAARSGCDVLWSEDMHHGLRVADTLTVINPFRAT